ncbi:calcium channel protein, partial [Gamsiella multidivaricata]
MVLGGQRYEYLPSNSQDSSNDPSSLSPNAAARGSSWACLARRGSDQSTIGDFELNPVNDRTGLTSSTRPLPPVAQDSQEDLLICSEATSNTHLEPPETSPRRRRGFHHNPSQVNGSTSGRGISSRSSATNSRLASMKQVLDRASTRVINLTGSSSRSQSSMPEVPNIFLNQPTEEEEQEVQSAHNGTATVRAAATITDTSTDIGAGTTTEEAMRISRTTSPHVAGINYFQQLPLDPQSIDPPLVGKSLFIFGPDSLFRKKINRFLNRTGVELLMLFLLMLNLAFLVVMISSPPGNDTVWGAHWTDYGLLVIFVLYTLEIAARIVVSGLVLKTEEGSTIRKHFGPKQRTDNLHDTNPTILRKQQTMTPAVTFRPPQPSLPLQHTAATRATTLLDFAVGRQTTVMQYIPTTLDPLIEYRPQFMAEKAQLPFLRHTFNRIDMVAVICYWIDFALMMAGVHNIYFFKTIAAMRTLRLLNITSGSSTILQSLKKSAPLLVNIALFIAFFFVIFSMVVEDQFCGGHYNVSAPNGISSYLTVDGGNSPTSPKGYICASNYVCKDTGENFKGVISFDVISSAMVPVYVLMTGQTWTDMMYSIMDAEYAWSAIYFVLVVLVMNFWILNLFVAVINEMFAKIRDDSANNSAFKSDGSENDSINNFSYRTQTDSEILRMKWLEGLECLWVLAVVVDLVFQCLPQYRTPPSTIQIYDRVELWFTVAFAVEIVIRFLSWPPTPKAFFQSKKNLVDLFLAVITLIIQTPLIHRSQAYVYLTIFQVLRVYRPIIYVGRLRSLIQRVVGSWIGLLNLVLFIAMFLGVVSVMAGILFREIIDPDSSSMNFSDFYVSYLGMYQLFSGENWTDILYSVMAAELPYKQVIIATVFIIAFYSFANFVLVNMLIAIIMENFEGEAEIGKHAQQIVDYASKAGYPKEEQRKFVDYLTKYLKPHPSSIGVDTKSSSWSRKMRKGLAREYLLGDKELFHATIEKEKDPLQESSNHKKNHHRRRSSQYELHYGPLNEDEIDDTEHFRKLYDAHRPRYEDVDGAYDAIAKPEPFFSAAAFRHRSLFIFGPQNKIRRFLQQFVTPGRGYRIEGKRENVLLSRPFNIFITLAILLCVGVAVYTTPVWRLEQSKLPSKDQNAIVGISDYVFPLFFAIEFLIRVIADGFIFTPDAYLKTLWNQIDFFVLLSLYAPLIATITNSQGTSRFFRALKALRALRLINQSAYIKNTFHAVLVAGFPQLLDATLLCMSILVPFAIYGMRLFAGLFFSCNDSSEGILSVDDCVGTFVTEDNVTMPRVWSNPHVYSFDNFWASFLILFEIVSQEGWTGVMETARNVAGLGQQPHQDVSRYNGIFFVLFNLAGGYFVTSLFVAIVIENYTKRTGTAFMTANQRRWMDLKKLLGGIKMSKAKTTPPSNPIRALCFRIASSKRGRFSLLLTTVTIANGVVLATEHIDSRDWEGVKNWIFLALLLVFMFEIFVKICGLGWTAYRKNRWNVYNSTVSICALIITIARLLGSEWQPLIQTQKLFLTAILFRLVPHSNSLNQLFMTMAASIRSIASLFGVWLVVFAVYGIMFVEIFGLTSYGPNGSTHVNFRNFGTSLLMMARMSTGEGWNDLMHDFAVEMPNCVNEPNNYLLSDCGSTAWAYTLFITFNIISMYIFTNMFIVVVMHNFSYVYQIAPGFSLITREEIRGFKRVWAEVDTDHIGYIQEKDLTRFLMKLRGVFDMRVFNEEHSLAKLQSRLETAKPNAVKMSARDLEKSSAGTNTQRRVLMLNQTNRRSTYNLDESQVEKGQDSSSRPNLYDKVHQDYNLAAFNSAIASVNKTEVRKRRKVYNFLYAEAVMSMEPIPGTELKTRRRWPHWFSSFFGGSRIGSDVGSPGAGDYEMGEIGEEFMEAQWGVSFPKMLTILAHYKLIEDDQCLSIGDMLRHRQKMDRIHAHINVVYVRSILLRMVLRQRFLKHYAKVQKIRALTDDTSSSTQVQSQQHSAPESDRSYSVGGGTGAGV